jgi:hypothetical protein
MAPSGHWLQDRKFQERLLAALERPKKHWFIRLVNSAAFLWLATLLLVTAAGGYLTNYQQCVRDSDLLADHYAKTLRELRTRHQAIADLVEKSGTVEEIRAGLTKLPNTYSEFREKTLFDLNRDLATLHASIDNTTLPNPGKSKYVQLGQWTIYTSRLNQGEIPADLTNDDLPLFKRFAKAYFQVFSEQLREESNDFYSPNCTFRNTLLHAFGVRGTKIVEAERFPWILPMRDLVPEP